MFEGFEGWSYSWTSLRCRKTSTSRTAVVEKYFSRFFFSQKIILQQKINAAPRKKVANNFHNPWFTHGGVFGTVKQKELHGGVFWTRFVQERTSRDSIYLKKKIPGGVFLTLFILTKIYCEYIRRHLLKKTNHGWVFGILNFFVKKKFNGGVF